MLLLQKHSSTWLIFTTSLITKYPKTDKGRRDFIHDAFKDIPDDGFEVIHFPKEKPDKTLNALNDIISGIITLTISPVILVSLIYGVIKWLFRVRYPISDEAKRIIATRKYLNESKHFDYGKN
jgi:hypothetical protein